MSRFDRQIRRAKWKRLSSFVKHRVITLPGTSTKIGIPHFARDPSFHDFAIAQGFRHKDFQKVLRRERLDDGMSATSTSMHRAHGHDVCAAGLRRRATEKAKNAGDSMASGGGG